MKRERSTSYDVIRQGSTISIVERRSGVASSLVVPDESVRLALISILSDPLEATVVPEVVEERKEAESEPTTEKKTSKRRTKKDAT